jgi:hypothetical protein
MTKEYPRVQALLTENMPIFRGVLNLKTPSESHNLKIETLYIFEQSCSNCNPRKVVYAVYPVLTISLRVDPETQILNGSYL